jgi:hypothetical protein
MTQDALSMTVAALMPCCYQSFTADRLINPSKAEAGSLLTGEQLIEKLLSGSVECAIRIGEHG